MTGQPPACDLEALVAEADFARRLARALVFDDHDADDVVQQTWLDALRRPPALASRSALRNWLATVIRRRAIDGLRDRRRRSEVERDGARDEVTLPSADELLAREEARRGVIDELRKLDEPFRTAVALRYLEGLDPVEIAARQGVPAATVRGRVRRGLAMLRERLDRRHGGDRDAWSVAILPLAAPAPASAGLAAILLSVGITMKLLWSFGAAAAAALLLVALWPTTPGPAETVGAPAPVAASPEVAQLDAGPAAPTESAAPIRMPADSPTAPEREPAVDAVRILGRCIDESGAPIAGASVDLQGWPGNDQRVAAWLLEHEAMPAWTDPEPIVTGPDGRFELAFRPFPPLQFAVGAKADDRVEIGFRWGEIEPGTVKDLGDIALVPGTRVRGRVVDPEGLPVVAKRVHISPPPLFGFRGGARGVDDGSPRNHGSAPTDESGRFEIGQVLPPGDYQFQVDARKVTDPAGVIRIDGPLVEHTVVAVDPTAGRRAIRGIVVDESGQPIVGATLGAGELPPFPTGFHHDGTTTGTGRSGRFTLYEPATASPDGVRLAAFADGFLRWNSPTDLAWGTEDLRITLRRGPSVTVRAVDEDGTPVERFGISLAPLRPNGRRSSWDAEVRVPGTHADGVATIEAVTPGSYELVVHPAESADFALPAPIDIEVDAGVPTHVEVRLSPLVAQRIEVVGPGGAPLPNVKVEFARHPTDGDIALDTLLMEERYARPQAASGKVGILEAAVTTEATGLATVRGTTDRRYALRFPGPGHVPTVLQPVRIDPERPLRVTLPTGGVVRGRLMPVAVLDPLRTHGPLAVALHGLDANAGNEIPTTGHGMARMSLGVAADGRFEITGVPPGPWQLALRWNEPFVLGATMKQRVAIERVEIVDGETVDVVLDVSTWRRHEVAVLTLLDGEPRSMQLQGKIRDARTGSVPPGTQTHSDGDGRATLQLEDGRWHFDLQPMIDGVSTCRLGIAVDVSGPIPANTPVRLEIRTARRAIRILRPDGTPAAGVELLVQQPAPDPRDPWTVPTAGSRPTDADGRTTLIGTPGMWTVRAPREPFRDVRAFIRWQAENQRPDGSLRMVDLGSVTLGGIEEPLGLRLPETWARLPD